MNSSNFPLRHISVRVPWHDSGWAGTVCRDPKRNTACLKLLNIAQSKDEAAEGALAGKSLHDLDPAKFPPCVKERGSFMAEFDLERFHEHPYMHTSRDTHAHFRPTRMRYPAYAAAALPFAGCTRTSSSAIPTGRSAASSTTIRSEAVDPSVEPELPFKTGWVQDHRNHRALLDCFWQHVRTEESLAFFYVKQAPLVEDTGRRILIGAGRVLKIGQPTEYDYACKPQDAKIRSLIWERMVSHSIRPDYTDGFLLPYREALAKGEDGLKFDPAEVVAVRA